MGRKHQLILAAIFRHPTASNVRWDDVLTLLEWYEAEFEAREGSRHAFILNEEVIVLHRPHPGSEIDKGAVQSLRKFLERAGKRPS